MKNPLKIHLKPNERIFINGAVLRVDRKVTLELLNDVVFLLENHVLQEEDATTPLRQLYFVVQSMLIEPRTIDMARQIYDGLHKQLIITYKNRDILDGLLEVKALVEGGKPFEALRRIRGLYKIEAEVLGTATGDKARDFVVA